MLANRIEGTGPDLLLLHAGVADLRMWDPLVAELHDEFRILRVDMPGFGESPVPAGPFSTAEMIAEVCAYHGLEQPIVVGNSFGGFVALTVAGLAGQLVLLSAWWPLEEWSAEHEAFGEQEDALIEAGDIDAAVELNVELWAPPGYEDLIRDAQRRIFELQLSDDPDDTDEEPDLDAISIPVVCAYGERDVSDFITIAELLADTLEDAVLVKIEDAAHLSPLERPDAIANLIRTAEQTALQD